MQTQLDEGLADGKASVWAANLHLRTGGCGYDSSNKVATKMSTLPRHLARFPGNVRPLPPRFTEIKQ